MDNKTALQMIAHRINGVQAMVLTVEDFDKLDKSSIGLKGRNQLSQSKADSEIARLKAARTDVLSRMSKDDVSVVEAAIAADIAARASRKDAQLSRLIKK